MTLPLNFEKIAVDYPAFWDYQLSKNKFFIQTKSLNVLEGEIMEEFLIDVGSLRAMPNSSNLIGSNSNANLTTLTNIESRRTVELKKYCLSYCEENGLLVLVTSDSKKGAYRDLELYDIKKQNYVTNNFLKTISIPKNFKIVNFPNYLVFYAGKRRNVTDNILLLVELSSMKIINLGRVFNELTDHIDRVSTQLKPLAVAQNSLYASYTELKHPTIPPSILKIDLVTQSIDKILDNKVFTNHEYEKGKWNFAFYPQRFVYDAASRSLISLVNQGCYVYDIDRDEATFYSLADSFGEEDLNALGQVTLYKNHLYFACAGPLDREKGRINYHLFAYSLATHSVVWRYDFPKDYLPNYVAAPKVNEKYLITHGSNSDLHIFKKIVV